MELNIDGLQKRILDERERYSRLLQEIPKSGNNADIQLHYNRANAQEYKLAGLEMALLILTNKQAA